MNRYRPNFFDNGTVIVNRMVQRATFNIERDTHSWLFKRSMFTRSRAVVAVVVQTLMTNRTRRATRTSNV